MSANAFRQIYPVPQTIKRTAKKTVMATAGIMLLAAGTGILTNSPITAFAVISIGALMLFWNEIKHG